MRYSLLLKQFGKRIRGLGVGQHQKQKRQKKQTSKTKTDTLRELSMQIDL